MVQQLQLPEQPAVSIMDTTAVGDFLVEEGDSGLVHPYWDAANERSDKIVEDYTKKLYRKTLFSWRKPSL